MIKTQSFFCLLLVATSLILTSCGDLQFTAAMPPDGAEIHEIPRALRGKYINPDGDVVTIKRHKVKQSNEDDTFSLKEDYFTLRQKGDWCYWNSYLEDHNSFYVVGLKLQGDSGIIARTFEFDDHEADKATITAITPIVKWHEGMVAYAIVNANQAEFDALFESDLTQDVFLRRK